MKLFLTFIFISQFGLICGAGEVHKKLEATPESEPSKTEQKELVEFDKFNEKFIEPLYKAYAQGHNVNDQQINGKNVKMTLKETKEKQILLFKNTITELRNLHQEWHEGKVTKVSVLEDKISSVVNKNSLKDNLEKMMEIYHPTPATKDWGDRREQYLSANTMRTQYLLSLDKLAGICTNLKSKKLNPATKVAQQQMLIDEKTNEGYGIALNVISYTSPAEGRTKMEQLLAVFFRNLAIYALELPELQDYVDKWRQKNAKLHGWEGF